MLMLRYFTFDDDKILNIYVHQYIRYRFNSFFLCVCFVVVSGGIKELLEHARLGKYRSKIADEEIDLEALRLLGRERDDEELKFALGIKDKDLTNFRLAIMPRD
jgi:hypothetical protein